MRISFIAAVLLGTAVFAGAGMAQSPVGEDPDWPCVQRKVPSLTPAAIWTGPVVDGTVRWRDDAQVAHLVDRLAQRRLPLESAEEEIAAFASMLGDDKEGRLTGLFAGLFEVMNAERSEIIAGIERYARRQKAIAKEIRTFTKRVEALRRSSSSDANELHEAEQALFWQTRIFNERRASLSFICETPRMVEQRLFSLGRTIGKALR